MKTTIRPDYWKCEWCGCQISDLNYKSGSKPKYHVECGEQKRYFYKKNNLYRKDHFLHIKRRGWRIEEWNCEECGRKITNLLTKGILPRLHPECKQKKAYRIKIEKQRLRMLSIIREWNCEECGGKWSGLLPTILPKYHKECAQKRNVRLDKEKVGVEIAITN